MANNTKNEMLKAMSKLFTTYGAEHVFDGLVDAAEMLASLELGTIVKGPRQAEVEHDAARAVAAAYRFKKFADRLEQADVSFADGLDMAADAALDPDAS